jgi:hypothetical protein
MRVGCRPTVAPTQGDLAAPDLIEIDKPVNAVAREPPAARWGIDRTAPSAEGRIQWVSPFL